MNLVFILVRLYRALPLLIVLAVVGIVVFSIVSYKYSRPKAKQVVIQVFMWINSILSAVFGIATVYALAEGNENATDLMGVFFGMMLVLLIITLICRHRFYKKNPAFKKKAQRATRENFFTRIRDSFKHQERIDVDAFSATRGDDTRED